MSVIACYNGIHIIAASAPDALHNIATAVEVELERLKRQLIEKDNEVSSLRHDLAIAMHELAKLKGESK